MKLSPRIEVKNKTKRIELLSGEIVSATNCRLCIFDISRVFTSNSSIYFSRASKDECHRVLYVLFNPLGTFDG